MVRQLKRSQHDIVEMTSNNKSCHDRIHTQQKHTNTQLKILFKTLANDGHDLDPSLPLGSFKTRRMF